MRAFFTRKRIVYGGIIGAVLLLIIFVVFKANSGNADTMVEDVKFGEIQKTVLATGSVISSTDVDLSFKSSGIVQDVNVKVGDSVKEGEVLANLDQGEESARVTQAQAALDEAEASYDKLIAGANTPEVNIAKSSVRSAEVALKNADRAYTATAFQQDNLVNNARLALYNAGLEAKRTKVVSGEVTATLSGAYQGTEEGYYRFELEFITSGFKVKYSGIENGVGTTNVKRGIATPLGTKGLYVTFSTDGSFSGNPVWRVDIPNLESDTYLTNLNAYNAAVQTRDSALLAAQNTLNSAQASLDEANSNLEDVLAEARPEDVAIAQAQILSAQGQLESAVAGLESTIIRAPADGTITSISVDEGEAASSTKPAMVLKDLENLYVEANIAEANISEVKLDQEVEFTFDALGSDRVFKGKVAQIDPASTLVSGIVNYKIKASVGKLEDIKPGMTANLKIIVNSKKDTLMIPKRSVVDKDGKVYVRVVTDEKKKSYEEQAVTLGIEGDGGVVEVVSGLKQGQKVISDKKDK